MDPTRRQICGLAGLAIGSISGCVQVPGNDGDGSDPTPPPEDDSEDEPDPSDTESEPEQSEDETEDEPEEPKEPQSPLQTRIADIFEYMEWMSYRYDRVEFQYYQALSDSLEKLVAIQDMENSEITEADIVTAADHLRTARRVSNDFDKYYSSHFPFESRANQIEDGLTNSLKRNEMDIFRRELKEHIDLVDGLAMSGNIDSRYPEYIIDQEPYSLFTTRDTYSPDNHATNHIFEMAYDGERNYGLYAVPAELNIIRPPPNRPKAGEERRFRSADDFTAFSYWNHPTGVTDRGNWLVVDDLPESDIWMNISLHDLTADDYPSDFTPDDDESLSDVPELVFDQTQSVGIYLQQFPDTETAKSAYDSLTERSTVAKTVDFLGAEYERLYHIGEKETYYADILQTGEYVIAVDIHSTPAKSQQLYDLTGISLPLSGDTSRREYLSENAETVSYASALEGTWLDIRD